MSTNEVQSRQLLIVDDDPSILGLVGMILKRAGYKVLKATNAQAAMEHLKDEKAEPIDCLITDAIMPGTNGYDFVRALRSDPRWGSLPILMLTKMGKMDHVREGMAAGVTDYVLKPVDEHLLLDKVRIALKKTAAERQVYEFSLYGPIADGTLSFPIQIAKVSESGLTLHSPIPIDSDHFRITGKILESIGLESPLLRFISCEKRAVEPGSMELPYDARFSFVGLGEADLRKIRSWLQRNAAQRRK